MNIVIAVDSFKGSLSSLQAGDIIVQAAQTIFPRAAIQRFPVADGGEGTVDALAKGLGGKIIAATVTGPLGEKIASRYGILPQTNRAIIEMADAAGLPLVPPEKRNPLHTTTYGLGELILQAAQAGCREFIIGIGGSATNDCGLGMTAALIVQLIVGHTSSKTGDRVWHVAGTLFVGAIGLGLSPFAQDMPVILSKSIFCHYFYSIVISVSKNFK